MLNPMPKTEQSRRGEKARREQGVFFQPRKCADAKGQQPDGDQHFHSSSEGSL